MGIPVYQGFRSAVASTSSSAQFVAWPSGYQVGDIAVVPVVCDTTINEASPIDQGWTILYHQGNLYVWYKRATSLSEPDFYVLRGPGSTFTIQGMVTFRGAVSVGVPVADSYHEEDADLATTLTIPIGGDAFDNTLVVTVHSNTFDSSTIQGTGVSFFTSIGGPALGSATSRLAKNTSLGDGGGFQLLTTPPNEVTAEYAEAYLLSASAHYGVVLSLIAAVPEGRFIISGSTAPTFKAASTGTFSFTGSTTALFDGAGTTTFSVEGTSSADFEGILSNERRFLADGTSDVDFEGTSSAESVFNSVGNGPANFYSPYVSQTVFAVDGTSTATFIAPSITVVTIVDGASNSGGDVEVVIDWSDGDFVRIPLTSSVSSCSIRHANLIPGKKLEVLVENTGASGGFFVTGSGITIDWGIFGIPEMPPIGTSRTFYFRAVSLTKIEAQRRWQDDGYTMIEVRETAPSVILPGRMFILLDP